MPMPDAAFAGVTEKEWLATVIEIATTYGWMSYHTHDSRHSAKGFPDLFLLNSTQKRALALELKREKGTATEEQIEWIASMNACGILAGVVRPSHMDFLLRLLSDEATPAEIQQLRGM